MTNNFVFETDLAAKKTHIAREFNAPIEKVWKAWTDPDLLEKWTAIENGRAISSTGMFCDTFYPKYQLPQEVSCLLTSSSSQRITKITMESIGRKSEIQNQRQKLRPICIASIPAANWKQLMIEYTVKIKAITKINLYLIY